MLAATGCHGVSIGRGALANPWIFRQLDQWERTGAWEPAGTFDERLDLMLRQFGYLVEQVGPARALPMFRKMAHWYLKGMRVRTHQRSQFQMAKTLAEIEAILGDIERDGPSRGTKTGILPDLHIPVPAGPVERW